MNLSAQFKTAIPVDLARPPHTEPLPHQLALKDSDSFVLTALVYDSSAAEPTEVMAGTVTGAALRPDGATAALTGEKGAELVTVTDAHGNAWKATPCSVTVSQQALLHPGRVILSVKLTDEGDTTTVLTASFTVNRTNSDQIVDGGDVIITIDTLIGEIEDAAADAAQAKADAEAAAAAAESTVSYAAQTLTDVEQAQARENIGAINADLNAGITGFVDYGALDQKQTSSSNSVSITTKPNYIKFNGTGTGTYSRRWRLYSTLTGYNGSHRGEFSASSGATLKAGHTYEVRARIIRGSVGASAGLAFQVYKVGTSTDLCTAIPRNDTETEKNYRFTLSTDTEVCLFVVYAKDASFTNCEIVYWIEDVTNGIRRLPPPTADGTYTLKVTVTSGVPTYSWVADGASLMMASPMLTTPLNSEDNPEETAEETPDEPTGEEER